MGERRKSVMAVIRPSDTIRPSGDQWGASSWKRAHQPLPEWCQAGFPRLVVDMKAYWILLQHRWEAQCAERRWEQPQKERHCWSCKCSWVYTDWWAMGEISRKSQKPELLERWQVGSPEPACRLGCVPRFSPVHRFSQLFCPEGTALGVWCRAFWRGKGWQATCPSLCQRRNQGQLGQKGDAISQWCCTKQRETNVTTLCLGRGGKAGPGHSPASQLGTWVHSWLFFLTDTPHLCPQGRAALCATSTGALCAGTISHPQRPGGSDWNLICLVCSEDILISISYNLLGKEAQLAAASLNGLCTQSNLLHSLFAALENLSVSLSEVSIAITAVVVKHRKWWTIQIVILLDSSCSSPTSLWNFTFWDITTEGDQPSARVCTELCPPAPRMTALAVCSAWTSASRTWGGCLLPELRDRPYVSDVLNKAAGKKQPADTSSCDPNVIHHWR